MKKHFIISTNTDLIRIPADQLVYISSDGNYCTLILADGSSRVVAMQLGQIEKMLRDIFDKEYCPLIRAGKSLIINRAYIYYIHLPKAQLILSDVATFSHQLTASKEVLKSLKENLEKQI